MIINPVAGSVTNVNALLQQFQRLRPEKIRVTRRAGQTEKLAADAVRAGFDFIISGGGDGTLNEIVNGIAGTRHLERVRLGILPLGTGNDFSRTLGFGKDIEENIEILLSQNTRKIDLVRARGKRLRHFVNISAGGFSGVVDEKLTAEIKRAWGPLAYLRTAAAVLSELRAYNTTVKFDDKEEISVELYNVIVANGQFAGGGLPVAPEADPRDGLLDVVLIPKLPGAEMTLLAAEILLGKHLGRVITRRARKVSVMSKPGMWFNLDGELSGKGPMNFEIVPSALTFVTR